MRLSSPSRAKLSFASIKSRGPTSEVVLHFTVSDTGIGISSENQARIFSAFEQADSSTTRNYGGTGLGLAIASKMVGLMDGEIWVESPEGCGSTFHFTAKFATNSAPAEEKARDRASMFEGMRVLVVDDNSTNRRVLEELLRDWRLRPVVHGGQRRSDGFSTGAGK